MAGLGYVLDCELVVADVMYGCGTRSSTSVYVELVFDPNRQWGGTVDGPGTRGRR